MLNAKDNEMIAAVGDLLAEAVKEKPNADEKLKADEEPKAGECQVETEIDRGSRCHTVLTYIEPKYLKVFLNSANWILHWAYCYHDKDVWSVRDEKANPNHKAGEPKTPHTHITLYTKDSKTYTAICKQFKKYSVSVYGSKNAQNTRSEYCDLNIQYRYLLHKDDPDKYQYTPERLVQDDPIFWEKYDKGMIDAPNCAYKIVEELLSGVSYRTLAIKYGRDFIYHAKQYEDCARHIITEECLGKGYIDDDLIYSVLCASHFSDADVTKFFQMLTYLREHFIENNMSSKFEIYLEKIGQIDPLVKIRKELKN